MTFPAGVPRSSMCSGIYREILIVMIPVGIAPAAGIMTVLALSREIGCGMIGIIGLIVIGFVARVAVGWSIGVSIAMAGNAAYSHVSSGQRELRLRMIKGGLIPCRSIMTGCAVVVKIILHVIWIGGAVKVSLVARVAVGWSVGVSIAMAGNAAYSHVSSCQRELGLRMIKGGLIPCCSVMTGCAVVVKVILHMIWIGGAVKVSLMAGVTIRRCAGITCAVAGYTIHCHMGSGQRELGLRMVERRRTPCIGVVAGCAVVVKVILHVIWIGGAVKVSLMARETIYRCAVVSCAVTGYTIH